jgi:predicted nucleotide-binding protein (sugar kinase/HSP70/actin superfamily)
VLLISPTDGDGYQETETYAPSLMRTGWRAVVSADLLMKLLLKTRPYECSRGDADHAYLASRRELCAALETPAASARAQMSHLVDTLTRIHDRFHTIPCRYDKGRLFIGIQGEIFCRMEDCSNGHLIRHLEACGAEAWLSDLSEWVWYSNTCEEQRLSHTSRLCSLAMLRAKLRDHAQRSDQQALHAPFAEDFEGYEEPKAPATLLKAGYAYLPFTCTEGEMVLSAGKVDHFFRHGVDGIIDVSPFSCMNGIVSEALYPRLSQDHAGLPVKSVYVDGTGRDLTSELEIFLELARTYQADKPHARVYPPTFRKQPGVSALARETGLAPSLSLAS